MTDTVTIRRELLERMQLSLSLDDTEWGHSAAEKYSLLSNIKAILAAPVQGEAKKLCQARDCAGDLREEWCPTCGASMQ